MMSLYEISLFNVYNLKRNNKISEDQLYDLPENVEEDLNSYLGCESPKKCFYRSISKEHFIFADFFLSQIINKIKAVNHGLAYAKNENSVDYLIKNKATIFDYGLIGAIINNDMNMIEYFINLGASGFDGALLEAVAENNILLIEYFIKKGADNFDEALVVSAEYGFDNLTELFLNLGANDYILALGTGIDNGHFTELLIPDTQEVRPCFLDDALLYFLRNTKFYSKSGVEINKLIPYVLREGYADQETVYLLMRLYLLNENTDHGIYYTAFSKFPSLYKTITRNGEGHLTINKNNDSTFANIERNNPGFYASFVDKLYFLNIIELNIRVVTNIDDEMKKQLWTELIIVEAIVKFYEI